MRPGLVGEIHLDCEEVEPIWRRLVHDQMRADLHDFGVFGNALAEAEMRLSTFLALTDADGGGLRKFRRIAGCFKLVAIGSKYQTSGKNDCE